MSERSRIGTSRGRTPIHAYTFAQRPHATLIVAGIHGDEPKSVYVARMLLEYLRVTPPPGTGASASAGTGAMPKRSAGMFPGAVVIVPVLNPDGYAKRRRRNAAGVDLNRNFPTADWCLTSAHRRNYSGRTPASEPETRALLNLIASLQPARIIAIHSINRHRHCNNYDGAAAQLARSMSRKNGYPVRSSIGYPTPGSLGTWAGRERVIPTITLELPSHHSPQRCWTDNRHALELCFL